MKLTLVPNPFVNVARIIAQMEPPRQPPEWLVAALKQFGAYIQASNDLTPAERELFSKQIKQMRDATETLLRLLPAFEHLGFGMRCPDEIATVLAALPRIGEFITKADSHRSSGRPLNARREICAAVVLEAWKFVHGKAQPYSEKFQEACNEYWQACGGEQIGEFGFAENWKRSAERARDGDQDWIRERLLIVQNPS